MTQGLRERPLTREADSGATAAEQSPARFPAWVVVGLLLVQAAWVLSVPPFRGIDEYDHAYRAAAVARGQWVAPSESATRGTGAFVSVPPDIVRAANAECEKLPYTGPDDCVGQGTGDGLVQVASGAGRYNPVFYAVVGLAALPFDGATALYVMRLATLLLCGALFALAMAATRRWARTRWPYLALVTAATPVTIYSASVVAPNGVEIMAALACWCSLIGLRRDESALRDRRLVLGATVAAVVLVTVRSLGPLWLLAIAATVLLAIPAGTSLRAMARDRAMISAAVATAVATAASVVWVLSARSLVIGKEDVEATTTRLDALVAAFQAVPLWLFQSIAAFPTRNEPAPALVYVCYLLLGIGFVGLGLRAAPRRIRIAMLAVLNLGLALPVAVTVATFTDYAIAWQGRYELPYTAGLLLLAGAALDRRGRQPRWRTAGPALVLFALANAVSVVNVLTTERSHSPQAGSDAWLMPGPLLIVALVVLGSVLLWLGAMSRATKEPA